METEKFDIAVIGAGPGGYVAAIKASQYGKKVVLIEKQHMGGTCLNTGCIPTKTLIANADVMHTVKHAAEFGIQTGPVSFDYAKMKHRKDGVVEKMRKGLEGLVKSNGITILQGHAEFTSAHSLKVLGPSNHLIAFDSAIIASGSQPLDIPAFPCDHQKIFNSTSILELTILPKTLAIIGGGYIGCEFASLYATLGVKVTVLEALPMILAPQGKTISDVMTRSFIKKGVDIQTGVMVEGIDSIAEGVRIKLKGKDPIVCEAALVAVGRKIVSEGMGIEKTGLSIGPRGVIDVNDKMETSVVGIYAIGDVTGKYMLAHVASHQGIVAASNAVGHTAKMHYEAVPAVIFTSPEISMVGMTVEQAQEANLPYVVGKFPFQALGKSVASMETEGFAQIITNKNTGQILGAQVIGHDAASLIAEIALAITNELTVDCITETIHAHPTLPEAWLEAALLTTDSAIHLPPKVKKV
ncbi:MAG: dihydrolipoyl dehydrogenase [Chlamydiae bacterium]|nr:dihydrolipoyl dehydrogenase [Chlamydiota bacterium]